MSALGRGQSALTRTGRMAALGGRKEGAKGTYCARCSRETGARDGVHARRCARNGDRRVGADGRGRGAIPRTSAIRCSRSVVVPKLPRRRPAPKLHVGQSVADATARGASGRVGGDRGVRFQAKPWWRRQLRGGRARARTCACAHTRPRALVRWGELGRAGRWLSLVVWHASQLLSSSWMCTRMPEAVVSHQRARNVCAKVIWARGGNLALSGER